jgi:hypothetical protein
MYTSYKLERGGNSHIYVLGYEVFRKEKVQIDQYVQVSPCIVEYL